MTVRGVFSQATLSRLVVLVVLLTRLDQSSGWDEYPWLRPFQSTQTSSEARSLDVFLHQDKELYDFCEEVEQDTKLHLLLGNFRYYVSDQSNP